MPNCYVLARDGIISENFYSQEELFDKYPDQIIEMKIEMMFLSASLKVQRAKLDNMDFLWEWISKKYREWGHFGKFGDVICLTINEALGILTYTLSGIFWLDWEKPVLASDMLLFFEVGRGNHLFVGALKVDKKTGEEYMALIGGIRNTNGKIFESASQAAIRETREEVGMSIGLIENDLIRKATFSASKVLFGTKKMSVIDHSAIMSYVGEYWTGESEYHSTTDTKRVHQTTVFMLRAEIDLDLMSDDIKVLFTPGDDVKDVFIWNINDGTPNFRSENHKIIYEKAKDRLLNILRAEM